MGKLNNTELVDVYISMLEPAVKETVTTIRQLVLDQDSEITEHIKWNSPSFYYTGEIQSFDAKEYKRDLLVCNLHRGQILLVFPTGAKIPDQLGGKNYPDGRKIVTIKDLADVRTKEVQLKQLIVDWLALLDKL